MVQFRRLRTPRPRNWKCRLGSGGCCYGRWVSGAGSRGSSSSSPLPGVDGSGSCRHCSRAGGKPRTCGARCSGFWLLTLIPQLPISFFFIVALPLQWSGENNAGMAMQLPFDRAGSILMLLFMVVEAVVGYYALRRMVKSQVLKFHMQHARDDAGAVHAD
mmetsp:Transcript_17512/g.35860  ORF Transcript_17512/g.35860 Transcript_17512/m.35860 type:complete len:160 (+) Transcript_17512:339-818(+)